jgi:hypothetical protein
LIGTNLADYFSNTHEISLSDRENNAIEHGVCDPQAAKTLEEKLTDAFSESDYSVDVKLPEECPGNSGPTDNTPRPK